MLVTIYGTLAHESYFKHIFAKCFHHIMAHLCNLVYILGIMLSLVSGSIIQQRQIDPEIERKINDYIHNVYLPAAKISTLALSIVQNDGEVLYTNGYGWANEEKEIPNTNETLFNIASVTKTFTATVLIKTLHEKFPDLGEAVLDTPIRTLIPEYNFTLIDRFRSEHGTIRDLLAHRMCLPRTDWTYHAEPFETTAETTYRLRYVEEMCEMRSEFQYQNHMFVMAGDILSHIAAKPYEEIAEEFLKNLGMKKSRFIRKTDDFANTPDIARPYYVDINDGSVVPMNPKLLLRGVAGNSAAGLMLTPNDAARFLRFLINLGSLDGQQIVPEDVMKWMRKPANHIPFDMFSYSFAYGQGLSLGQYNGWEFLYHGGNILPYHNQLSIFPAKKLGIFTSTNQGPLKTDRIALHTFIFDILNGAEDAEEKARKVMAEFREKEELKKINQVKAMDNFIKKSMTLGGNLRMDAEELIGKYGSGAQGDVEILEKWNNEMNEMGLYIQYGKWATGFLEHVEGPLYRILFDTDILQYFYGRKDIFFLRVDADEIEFLTIINGGEESYGKFTLGVNLENLPPIPWLPESC